MRLVVILNHSKCDWLLFLTTTNTLGCYCSQRRLLLPMFTYELGASDYTSVNRNDSEHCSYDKPLRQPLVNVEVIGL